MTKREFLEQAAPLFRVGMMERGGNDKYRTETAVLIAEDLWAEIEKRCPVRIPEGA